MKALDELLKNNFTQAQVYQELNRIKTEFERDFYQDKPIDFNKKRKEKEKLDSLAEGIRHLPRLRLTLAFKPTQQEIEEIGRWVRENVHPHVVLDLRLDARLLAGARLAWQGRVYDLSLREGLRRKRREIALLWQK